jgi:hypothetical protein
MRQRYLILAVVFFAPALIIACFAYGQDTGTYTTPPPLTCNATIMPYMVPGVIYVQCGPVPAPCTCTLTFPEGQTSAGLQIKPDSDVTVNIVGGGQ